MLMQTVVKRAWHCVALLLAMGAAAGTALADPPGRVARIGYLSGQVSFQAAGDDRWVEVGLNRPLGTGDRLYTDVSSRVELQMGAATVRLDDRSTFSLINLDDDLAQMELTEGVLNLRVYGVSAGQTYEVDTPTLAFVVNRPGNYRIDIDPAGRSTMVTVFDGAGDVYGERNASYSVSRGNSYRFHDSALRDYEVMDLPRPDDFDRWADAREDRLNNSVSRRYVADDMIGYSDLDEYGTWTTVAEYGSVWYPTRVSVGWAPYRHGHWSWIDPWGWTWIDNYSWGFAPFHYGRWVYTGNRWGWCPGPRHVRAVYAPALVGFIGGGGWGVSISAGGPVGWFPLGPRDVYVPWYRASRHYFTNVNVHNTTVINNTYITNVYNNYSAGRPITGVDYAYSRNRAALTAVSRDAFVGGRVVTAQSRVRIDDAQLRNAQVVSRVAIAPTRASFVPATAARGRAAPASALERTVVARTAPPTARAIPIEQRVQAIQRNNAQPLAREQMRELAAQRPSGSRATSSERVRVVGTPSASAPRPLPARSASSRQGAPSRDATPADRERLMPAERTPASTRSQGTRSTTTPPRTTPAGGEARTRSTSGNREALPSTRFAPRSGTTPRSTTPAASEPRASTPSRSTPSRSTPAARSTPTTPRIERTTPAATPRTVAPRESTTTRATPPRTTTTRSTSPSPARSSQPVQRAPQVQRVESPQRSAPAVQRATPVQRAAPKVERPQPAQRTAPAAQRSQPAARSESRSTSSRSSTKREQAGDDRRR